MIRIPLPVLWALTGSCFACTAHDGRDPGSTEPSVIGTTPSGTSAPAPSATGSPSSALTSGPPTAQAPSASLVSTASAAPSMNVAPAVSAAPSMSSAATAGPAATTGIEPNASAVPSMSSAPTPSAALSASGSSTAPDVSGNAPHTVWLAGDSTVANGNTPCPTGWGKHFQALFDDTITVVNSAVGGRSVRTWMYLVQTEMGPDGECLRTTGADGQPAVQDRWQAMLDGMQAGDALLIQFGINDGSATCDRHVGLAAFKESYGVLAAAAKARDVQPVFITPVSSIACGSNGQPTGTRGGYVTATFEAGEQFDVPVIDLHQRSVERYGELGFCPVPGGDVSASTGGDVGEYFCDDHTHFSETGAPDIAALVAEGLRDLDLPLASALK